MEASKATKKANSEAKKAKPQAKKYPNKHSSPSAEDLLTLTETSVHPIPSKLPIDRLLRSLLSIEDHITPEVTHITPELHQKFEGQSHPITPELH
uniref:Uncharacterized protein n=1 Tax=Oryza meridionalis TaxID=40149 RepID=A0A0E0DWB3_9ORYZ